MAVIPPNIEEALQEEEANGQRGEVGFLRINWDKRSFEVGGLCGDEDPDNNLTTRQVLGKLMEETGAHVETWALAAWDDNHQLSLLDLPLFLSEFLGVES